MWLQIVDRPDVAGNYIETSGSAMLAYAMYKGVRLGILDREYAAMADRTLAGIERRYLRHDGGQYVLGGTCAVAGLTISGETVRSNTICQTDRRNEVKGIAPYFFAYDEKLRMKKDPER